MKLSDAEIRSAQPRDKEFKFYDEDGLFLLVHPNGSRYWKMKYRFAGREKKLSFGVYPEVTLKEARQRCDQARRDLRDGIDPSIKKKIAKIAAAENSFKAVAEEWLELLKNPPKNPKGKQQKAPLAEGTLEHKRSWLDDYILPQIGSRPINAITAPEILDVCRRVERQGIIETAHRVRSTCSRIFRYGIATSRCERPSSGHHRSPDTCRGHQSRRADRATGCGRLPAHDRRLSRRTGHAIGAAHSAARVPAVE